MLICEDELLTVSHSFSTAIAAFPHKETYKVKELSGSSLNIEGNGDCGHIVAREAIDLALQHLPKHKVFTMGICNITRFNTPGCYSAVWW
jgi:ureidoglycolate dehydrogenase (NAD+)/L-2-hydroxycarboxylate dehydrogenase (NAD+)